MNKQSEKFPPHKWVVPHAGVGYARDVRSFEEREHEIIYISKLESEALIAAKVAEARAQALQDAKNRIKEICELNYKRNMNEPRVLGLSQAWGLVHELEEYLAKKSARKEAGV